MSVLVVNWGPVSAWVGAAATFMVVLVALGIFDAFRAPRLQITFENTQPWRREVKALDGTNAVWIRIGVRNTGKRPARGCVGRMIGLATEGARRTDIDPMQLRWAGMPRSKAFDAWDLRRDQFEFLNVLVLTAEPGWRIVTFDGDDFDPGFDTRLSADQSHVLHVAVFSDNARTIVRALVVQRRGPASEVSVTMLPPEAPWETALRAISMRPSSSPPPGES